MSTEYHKIQSVFMRDPATKFKTFLPEYSCEEFEYLRNCEWEWTEKIDGTNIRVMWDGERVKIGGRTDRAQIPATLVQRLDEILPPEKMKAQFGAGEVILYGEGCGPGIQKGGGYFDHVEFVLFDIKIGQWWLKRKDVQGIAQGLGILDSPIMFASDIKGAELIVKRGFFSTFQSAKGAMKAAEGLVGRPRCEMSGRDGKRIITKLKTKDWEKGDTIRGKG